MTYSHYIQGAWTSGSGPLFDSYNPQTDELLWQGPSASAADIEKAVATAKKAFSSWSAMGVEERLSFLQAFRSALLQNKENIALTISAETGKPHWEALTEVQAIAAKVDHSTNAYRERCNTVSQAQGDMQAKISYKPHGVIGILGPFNFPGHLPHGHIIPALLAGNTAVFKPSDKTPLVAIELMKIWHSAGLPAGVLNLIQGRGDIGQALALHQDLQALCFTGSDAIGCHLAKLLASHPDKLLALEMGGNNPLIASHCTNAHAAALIIIQSAFLTAGQRCTCARRLILHQGPLAENILEALLRAIPRIRIGKATQNPEPFMGCVIDNKAADNILKAQQHLKSLGGKILIPVTRLMPGLPFLSAGLIDMTEASQRPDEEIFGPMLQVVRTKNLAESLLEANNTRYGLAAGLISDDPAEYAFFEKHIKAGIVNWNTPLTGASSSAPFGGIGLSGNYRPSAYYAADYCSYPIASLLKSQIGISKETEALVLGT